MSRKTYTAPEIKDAWNREHYDQLMIRVRIGSRRVVQQLAAEQGMSTAEYVRHLIIADARQRGIGDISATIGGGGRLSESDVRRALRPLLGSA